jgi:thiamine-monophosphate kinase
VNEWEWIEFLKSRAAASGAAPSGTVGIGDDAAVLPDGWIVSVDAFVEGVHFRPEWDSWSGIGRKAAEAAISDIAAMGARPSFLFATLSAHRDAGCAEGILDGILAAGIPLVGGDTTSTALGAAALSLTVIGRTDHPVLRSGARPGDRIWVSGPLGGGIGGFVSLEKTLGIRELEERFLHPRARVDLAESWGRAATAMIDISDGLSSELHHIAAASGVRIEIDAARVPLHSALVRLGGDPLKIALSSGDEYELLATSSEPLPGGIEIGRVASGSGVFCDSAPIPPSGWTHWT